MHDASRNQEEPFLWQVYHYLTDVCKPIINNYFKHNNFLIAAASASIYHKTYSWIVEIGDPCKYVKIPYKMHVAIVMTTITFLNDYLSYSGW